jgi:hypothetical protein
MYLHCKAGFVEADQWDGTRIPDSNQQAIAQACRQAGGNAIIVRSRDGVTLVALLGDVGIDREVFHTPAWDYPFRCYVTVDEWMRMLQGVALNLDYRNFKHWTGQNRNPGEHELAFRIWQAAYDEGRARR